MDILAIREAIQQLEADETTFENVKELAALYTVYDHAVQESQDAVQNELSDILPYYQKYISIKRRYQLNQVIDSEVIQGIQAVCKELREFIEVLYNNTDMHRERMCIRKLINELAEKYKD